MKHSQQAFQDICDDPNWESAPQIQTSCPGCLKTYFHNKYLLELFPNALCEACQGSQKVFDPLIPYLPPDQDPERILARILPPNYLRSDHSLLPQPQLAQVLQFNPDDPLGHGLYLVGPSRTGKTRSLATLIRSLVENHLPSLANPPTLLFPGQLHQKILDSIQSRRNHKTLVNRIATAPILAFDDIFNESFTDTTESALFEIIDHRIAHKLPTIYTSQFSLRQATSKLSCPIRAQAIVKRIKESTSPVIFNHKQTILPV